jgi:hypothetical protein
MLDAVLARAMPISASAHTNAPWPWFMGSWTWSARSCLHLDGLFVGRPRTGMRRAVGIVHRIAFAGNRETLPGWSTGTARSATSRRRDGLTEGKAMSPMGSTMRSRQKVDVVDNIRPSRPRENWVACEANARKSGGASDCRIEPDRERQALVCACQDRSCQSGVCYELRWPPT